MMEPVDTASGRKHMIVVPACWNIFRQSGEDPDLFVSIPRGMDDRRQIRRLSNTHHNVRSLNGMVVPFAYDNSHSLPGYRCRGHEVQEVYRA